MLLKDGGNYGGKLSYVYKLCQISFCACLALPLSYSAKSSQGLVQRDVTVHDEVDLF